MAAVAISAFCPSGLYAADRYFTGGVNSDWDNTGNWSDTSGGILPASVPDNGDRAIFDNNSPNCTVEATVSPDVNLLDVRATFTNTLDFNDQDVTIRSSFSLASGTLNLGDGTILVDDATWTVSGGTLNREGSTVRFVGNNTITDTHTLNHVTLENNNTGTRSITLSGGSTLTVAGTLTFDNTSTGALEIRTGTLAAQGNITVADAFAYRDASGGRLLINGSADQTFTGNATQASGDLPDLEINKPSGTLTFLGTLRTRNNWTHSAGATAGTGTVVFGYNLTVSGSHSIPNVTLDTNDNNTRTITIAAGTTLTVPGLLTFENSNTGSTVINTGTIVSTGNITVGNNRRYGGSATLLINGAADQAFSGAATQSSGDLPLVRIDKPSGTLTFTGTIRTRRNWTHIAGATAGTGTVVFGYTLTISGSHILPNVTIDTNDTDTRTITIAAGTTLTVTGLLTLDNSNTARTPINTGTIAARGDISVDDRSYGGSGTILIVGTTDQTFTGAATQTSGRLPDIEINKTGGTLTLAGTIRTWRDWTYTAGTINAGTSTVVFRPESDYTTTITGSHTLNNVTIDNTNTSGENFSIASGTTLTVSGHLRLDSTSTGDVWINTGTIAAQGDITVDNRGYGGTGTLLINGTGNQTFTGSATQTSGRLPNIEINNPGGTLTLAGTLRTWRDWTYTAGTVDAGTSTVVIRPESSYTTTITGSHTLNNVTIDNNNTSGETMTISAGTTLTVTGLLRLANTSTGETNINTGTIAAQGDITTNHRRYFGSGTIVINGSGDQTFTGSASQTSGSVPSVVINKTGGTLTLGGTIRTCYHWTYTAGSLDAGSSTIVFAYHNMTTTNITGSHTLNNVTFDINSSSDRNKDLTAGTTLTVTGTLRLDNSNTAMTRLNTGTIAAQGNIIVDNRRYGGSGTILINGAGNQTFTGSATRTNGALPDLEINKPGGTLSLVGTIRPCGDWTYTAGSLAPGTSTVVFGVNDQTTTNITGSHLLNDVTFDANNSNTRTKNIAAGTTLTVSGDLLLDNTNSGTTTINTGTLAALGNVNIGSGSAFNGSGVLLFTGVAAQVLTLVEEDESRLDLDVVVNKTGNQLTLGSYLLMDAANQDMIVEEGTLDIEGQVLLVNGASSTFIVEDGGNFQWHGDETATQPTLNAGSTVTYDGTAGPYSVSDWDYHHLTFNGPGAVFDLTAAEALAGNLTVTDGTFDISGFDLTVGATFSNDGVFRLQGVETTVALTMDTDSGTVEYDGAVAYASLRAGNAYYNLTFNGTGSWQHTGTLDVDGDLAIVSGTLNSAGQDITLAGDWVNSGTYTSGANTVTLDGGSQSVSGNNAFRDLTKIVATAETLTFGSGQTQTIAGNLTLQGAAGDRLVISSDSPGTQWRIDPQGGRTIANLEVIDSNNINVAPVDARGTGSVDGGNNTNWLFDAATGFVWQGGIDANWNTPGNWAGGTVPGAGDVAIFSGAYDADCTINVGINVAGIDIKPGYDGTISQGASAITVGASGWKQASGTFAGGSATIDANGPISLNSGIFTSTTGELQANANWSSNAGSLTFNANGGTVRFDVGAATQTIDAGSVVFNDVTVNGDGTNGHYDITGTMDVNGDLTIVSIGSLNVGTIAAAGNVATTDIGVPGTATVLFDGSGAQTLGAGGGTGQLPNVEIDKSGGTLTLQDTLETPGNWTYSAGTVDAGTSTVRFVVGAATRTIDSGSMAFNDVDFNGDDANGNYTITGTMYIGGDLSISQIGSLNSGALAVAGNLTSTHATVGGNASITLNGSGAQSINVGTFDLPSGNLTIDKPNGAATLLATLSLNETDQGLIITSGMLDLDGNDLAINDVFSLGANGTLVLQGAENVNKGPTANSGTVRYNGTSGPYTVKDWDYHHLALDAAGTVFNLGTNVAASGDLTITSGSTLDLAGNGLSAVGMFNNDGLFRLEGGESVLLTADTDSGTVEYYGAGSYSSLAVGVNYYHIVFSGTGSWTIHSHADVNGSLSLSGGTLNDGGWNISLASNWAQSGTGSLSASGTVILNGFGQALTGSTTFASLTKTTTVAETLTFENGQTQTVTDTLTLRGALGIPLALSSDVDGNQWSINPQGTRDIAYLTVKDSNNVNALAIDATGTGSVNLGNNIYWTFDATNGFTWEGDEDANWSTPGNWFGGAVPGTNDIAIFDGSISNNPCTIDLGIAVEGIEVRANYTGAITSGTYVVPAVTGGQQGLAGDYYNGTNFDHYQGTYIDGIVDFDPADTAIGTNRAGGSDTFSVRWTGEVQADFSETYTFYTRSDDGVRLWVNGQQLVNNWTDHGPTENSGTIDLVAGQWYSVQLEFYERGGGSVIQLSYSSPSEAKKIIPATNMRTVARGATTLSVSLLFDAAGFSQASGTFNGSASRISFVNGPFTLTGGTFNASSDLMSVDRNWTHTGGTFNASGGSVTFGNGDGTRTITGSTTFHNLTFDSGSDSTRTWTIASGTTLTATGTLTLRNSNTGLTNLNTGTIEAQGDVVVTNMRYDGTATIIISGAGNQTFTGSATQGAGGLPNIVIDKPSGTLAMAGTIRTWRNWTYQNGTVNPGTCTLVFRPETDFNTTISGSHPLHNLTIATNSSSPERLTIALGTTITLSGTLAFANSSTGETWINTGTIAAQGDIVVDGERHGGTATILINGTGNQTFTGAAIATHGRVPNVVIDKPSGTLSLAGTIRTRRDWTYVSGTLAPGTSTVVLRPETSYTSTISGTHTLNNVTINADTSSPETLTIPAGTTLNVLGTLRFDNTGTGETWINTGTISAQGDIEMDNQRHYGSATILINGAGDQTFTGTSTLTQGSLPDVVIDKPGGTLTLAGTIRLCYDWTYIVGTLDPGTSTVVFAHRATTTYVNGSHTLNNVVFNINSGSTRNKVIPAADTLTVAGTLTLDNSSNGTTNINGGLLHAQGNVVVGAGSDFNGSSTLRFVGAAAQSFNLTGGENRLNMDLEIDKPANTVSLASALVLDRTGQDLPIIAGTLDMATHDLTVVDVLAIDGSLIQGSGTLSAGTITLNGGSWTNQSTGDITVGPGGVLNNGTITLDGTPVGWGDADTILIRSSASPAQRPWSGGGIFNVQDVNVLDQGGTSAIRVFSGTDAGNNGPNWIFDPVGPGNRYWIGAGAGDFNDNTRWSTTPGGPNDTTAPGVNDIAVFGAGTGNCAIPADVDIRGIRIDPGYPGTVTQNANVTITLGVEGFTQDGGTFLGNKGDIDVNGNFAVNGGSFTSTTGTLSVSQDFIHSGGAFAHNNGTVMLDNKVDNTLTISATTVFNDLKLETMLDSGLMGHWRLDDGDGGGVNTTAADSSGSGATGTLTNMTADAADWVAGCPSVNFTNPHALDFDGADDHVNIGTPGNLNITQRITVAAWIRSRANPSDWKDVVSHGHDGYFVSVRGNGRLTVGRQSSGPQVDSISTSPGDGSWHHIAYTSDGATVRVYIDGNLDNTQSASISYVNNSNLWIGGDEDYNERFDGQIDDLRIYNRALASAEISVLAAGDEYGKSSATTTLAGAALNVDGDLYLNSNILNVGPGNLGVQLAGSWINNGGGFEARSGTVTLDGNAAGEVLLTRGQHFNNLVVDGVGGGWTLSDRLYVDSILGLTNGELDVNAAGNYVVHAGTITQTAGGVFDAHNGTVVVDAASGQTLTVLSPLNNLRVEDPTENGLTGYWKLDEGVDSTARDSSPSAFHGSLVNAPSWDPAASSAIAIDNPYCLDFNGTNSYVELGNVLEVNDSADFSLSGWFNRDTSTTSDAILAKRNGTAVSNVGYIVYIDDLDDKLYLEVSDGTNEYRMRSLSTFTATGWNHFAIVWDQDDAAESKIYINGVEVVTETAGTIDAVGSLANGISLRIGAESDGGNPFDGRLDEIRFYNRALTSNEVAGLAVGSYANGASGTATYTLGADCVLNGTLAVDSGVFSPVAQNVTVANAVVMLPGNGVYQGGSGTQTFGGGLNMSGGTFAGGTGFVDMNGDLVITDGSFTSTGGSLNLSANLDYSGGTFAHNNGVFIFDGTSTVTGTSTATFNNVTVSGTLNGHATGMNVDGNWSNAGAFNHNSGMVSFTGAGISVIYGSSTFFNFDSQTPSKVLTFEAGTTQTVAGAFTVNGQATGTRIRLNSTVPGSIWSIDPQGTRNVQYVEVQDSVNLTGPAINPPYSIDGGNTTLWFDLMGNPLATPVAIVLGQSSVLTSSPAGGSGVYTSLLWTGPGGFTFSGQNPGGVTPTTTGLHTYTLVVTDSDGNTQTSAVTVGVADSAVTVTASSSPVAVVLGQSVTLMTTVTGGSGVYVSYQWTGPNGFTSNQANPTGVMPPFIGANTYTVVVTDSYGFQDTAQVTVYAAATALLANPSVTPPVTVAGWDVDLASNPTGGSGIYLSFSWTGPNGFTSNLQNPGLTPIPGTGMFIYTLTVVDSYGLVSTQSVTAFGVGSALLPNPSASSTLIHFGDSTSLSCNPTGGTGVYVSYQWTGPGGFTSNLQNPGLVTPPNLGVNTYTVTVVDASGLVASASVDVVTASELPSTGILIESGKLRYRAFRDPASLLPKDRVKMKIKGLHLRTGDRMAFSINNHRFGNLSSEDGLRLDEKLKAKGQIVVWGVGEMADAKLRSKKRKPQVIIRVKGAFGGTTVIQDQSGVSQEMIIGIYVDRAPADGIIDEMGLLPLKFKVKVRSKQGVFKTESGKSL